ncbi:hypothetical protein ACK36K_00540 [Aeromonas veronii]
MQNNVTIPFWSIDAYFYFIMPSTSVKVWSSELMSRVSSFVDAYVLFDKISIPERYADYDELKLLDPDGSIFNFVKSESLHHSDDITKGITIDISLNSPSMDSLSKDNFKWYVQHSGHASREDYEEITKDSPITMTHLRLWQFGLVNEIADNTNSSIILPLSLQELEINSNSRKLPFHVDKLSELDSHFQGIVKTVTATSGEEFTDYIENCPPFLSLLIDQSTSTEHSFQTLMQLRRDYSSLRHLNIQYQTDIKNEQSIRGKKFIIDEWNTSWESMLKGDFKKPQLLKKKISNSDVSKAIIKPSSVGLSTIIQTYLDYRDQNKAFSRFKVYSELYKEIDGISCSQSNLNSKFNVVLMHKL